MQMTTTIEGKAQTMQTGDMQQEMNRINTKGGMAATPYQHSFGLFESKTEYVNPWAMGIDGKSLDERPALYGYACKGKQVMQEIQIKALGTTAGGAGTAGYALVPVFVDPIIVDRSRKYTPLVELIPRVTQMGMYADFNVITEKGAAYTAGEDAPQTEHNDTEDRVSVPIKFLYSTGRVTGPMQAAMPSYIVAGMTPTGAGVGPTTFSPGSATSAKQKEVLTKSRAMKELEENLILNGSISSDATQYDGIVIQQSTTNQYDADSAELTWKMVEKTIRYAYDDGGRPNLAVCSSDVFIDLRMLMIDSGRYDMANLAAGSVLPFGVPSQIVIQSMVGPISVIPSMFLSNTSGSKQIFFLDTDFIEMRVLQDMTYEELAHINDTSKFMLKIYECLIMRAPQFNSFIDNLY